MVASCNDKGIRKEGAVELAKIAGVPPVAYIIEILADDGQWPEK